MVVFSGIICLNLECWYSETHQLVIYLRGIDESLKFTEEQAFSTYLLMFQLAHQSFQFVHQIQALVGQFKRSFFKL